MKTQKIVFPLLLLSIFIIVIISQLLFKSQSCVMMTSITTCFSVPVVSDVRSKGSIVKSISESSAR